MQRTKTVQFRNIDKNVLGQIVKHGNFRYMEERYLVRKMNERC